MYTFGKDHHGYVPNRYLMTKDLARLAGSVVQIDPKTLPKELLEQYCKGRQQPKGENYHG